MPSLFEVLIPSFVPRGTTSIYFTHTFLVPRGTKGGSVIYSLSLPLFHVEQTNASLSRSPLGH